MDCVCYFFEIGMIIWLFDLMVFLKMNCFYWYFVDDEVFWLELKNLLEFKRIYFCGEDELVLGVFGGGVCVGGSYFKEDVKFFVDYVKFFFIEVMLEIEVLVYVFLFCVVYLEICDFKDIGIEIFV